MTSKSCSLFTPLLSVTLAASVIIIGGCASSGQLPRQPGIGDESMDLLSERQSSIDDMRDARLRRQGLSVVRDADNQIQGYQVYTHGRDWGTPIGH